ncbi:hypothetical protein NUSPORA_00345 [Nucleospora cyclopteri]
MKLFWFKLIFLTIKTSSFNYKDLNNPAMEFKLVFENNMPRCNIFVDKINLLVCKKLFDPDESNEQGLNTPDWEHFSIILSERNFMVEENVPFEFFNINNYDFIKLTQNQSNKYDFLVGLVYENLQRYVNCTDGFYETNDLLENVELNDNIISEDEIKNCILLHIIRSEHTKVDESDITLTDYIFFHNFFDSIGNELYVSFRSVLLLCYKTNNFDKHLFKHHSFTRYFSIGKKRIQLFYNRNVVICDLFYRITKLKDCIYIFALKHPFVCEIANIISVNVYLIQDDVSYVISNVTATETLKIQTLLNKCRYEDQLFNNNWNILLQEYGDKPPVEIPKTPFYDEQKVVEIRKNLAEKTKKEIQYWFFIIIIFLVILLSFVFIIAILLQKKTEYK